MEHIPLTPSLISESFGRNPFHHATILDFFAYICHRGFNYDPENDAHAFQGRFWTSSKRPNDFLTRMILLLLHIFVDLGSAVLLLLPNKSIIKERLQ